MPYISEKYYLSSIFVVLDWDYEKGHKKSESFFQEAF